MIRFLLILPAAILLWGCTGKEQRAVPRRPAYPRVEAFRDTVKEVRAGNYLLSVNACATVTEPREGWLDVSYPGYGAVLHLTATEAPTPESLAAAVDNRLQCGGYSGHATSVRQCRPDELHITGSPHGSYTPAVYCGGRQGIG